MTSLTHRLESLRLEDGRPDVQARKAELESLLQALTDNEIRHLRPHLNAKTFQKDICANIPVELLLCVSQYLELEDLKRALSVSHRWNEVFSSPDFHLGIVKLHFIQIWETTYKGLEPEKQQIRKHALHNWLPGAALKRIKRLRGRYHSTSEYHYAWGKQCPLLFHDRFDRPQYCNGRVGYKVNDATIMVRSLRTEHAAVFADENRVRFSKWLLTDQFIVAQLENPAILLAWPLDAGEGDGPYYVRLPSQARHISGHRSQVGIITAHNEVLVWQVGDQLKSISTSELKEQLPGCEVRTLGLAFDPEDEKRRFVVHVASTDVPDAVGAYMTTLAVQECTDSIPKELHRFDLFSSRPGMNFKHHVVSLEDGSIGIPEADEVFYIPGNTKEHAGKPVPYPHPCKHNWIDLSQGGNDTLGLLIVVKFDIHTRAFSTGSYHLPDNSIDNTSTIFHYGVELNQGHIWRDQALLPVYRTGHSIQKSTPGVEDMIAMSVTECSKIQKRAGPIEIPWYGKLGSEDRQTHKMLDDSMLADSGAAFCWIGGMQFAEDARLSLGTDSNDQSDQSRFVRGDDDFVVLFGDEGYVVWCFDEDVRLPVTASSLDPVLQDSRLYLPHPLRRRED